MLVSAFATADTVSIDDTRLPVRPPTVDLLAERMIAGSVRTIEAKEHIFCDGDTVGHVYKVEIGNVCIYKTLSDGRRQVIDFAYPGDLIGLGAISKHASNAQATTRTRVRCVPIGPLQQAARDDGRLGLKLYEALSRELLASRELLFAVSHRTAAERLASFLLAVSRRSERNGEDANEFVLPMTRSDIADFLGLTIETVSRTFSKFRGDGLIDLAQSVLVTIVDIEALGDIAEGRSH